MAMGMEMGFSFILMIALSNGGGELLQLADTQAYWNARGIQPTAAYLLPIIATDAGPADDKRIAKLIEQLGADTFAQREEAASQLIRIGEPARPALTLAQSHDDPEIQTRAEQILQELKGDDHTAQINRLMAIRTLGELKSTDALPHLEKLAASTTPFESLYASRAIALIKGQALAAPVLDHATLESDLALLPESCNVVGQFKSSGSDLITLDTLLTQGFLPPGTDTSAMKTQATSQIVQLATALGNLSIDAATFGISGKANSPEFFVTAILRGQCDPDAIIASFKQRPSRNQVTTDGDLRILKPERELAIIFVNDRLVIFVAGDQVDSALSTMTTAIKSNKGGFAANKTLKALADRVDRKAHNAWLATQLDESYRQADFLKPIDQVTFWIHRDPAKTTFHLHAQGSDPAALASTVQEINQFITNTTQQMQAMAAMIPAAQKLVNALKAAQPRLEGNAIQIDLQIEGNPAALLSLPMMMGFRVAG